MFPNGNTIIHVSLDSDHLNKDVRTPERGVPAIRSGIEQTRNSVPVLLEFITGKETRISGP